MTSGTSTAHKPPQSCTASNINVVSGGHYHHLFSTCNVVFNANTCFPKKFTFTIMSDVTASYDPYLHQIESPARDYLKCPQCRKDGKKCLPNNNLHTIMNAKCCRCARLGHACGPRERAVGRRKSGTATRRSTKSNDGPPKLDHELAQQQMVVLPSGLATTPQSLSTRLDRLLELLAMQQILFRCRCELALLLRKLPDDSAFKQHDRYLKSLNSKLMLQYQKVMTSGNAIIERRGQVLEPNQSLLHENLRLKFEILQLQCLRLSTISWPEHSETVFTNSNFATQHLVLTSPPLEYVSCTRQISAVIDPFTLRIREGSTVPALDIEDYLKAQEQLQPILERTFAEGNASQEAPSSNAVNNEHKASHIFFPASHLAYWNLDKEAAFKLSTCTGVLDLPFNTFNHTLVHIAVKACDVGFLKKLIDFDRDTLERASIMGSGYSPLDLATILDDFDVFGLLVGRCINVSLWTPHLLHLAIAANSPNVVDTILERRRVVLPPYTRVAAEAIEKGAEDIALKFLPWLRLPWTTREDVRKLAIWAEEKRLHRLAAHLHFIQRPAHAPNQAIASLQQHLDFLMNDESNPLLVTLDDSEPSSCDFTEALDSGWSSLISDELLDEAHLES